MKRARNFLIAVIIVITAAVICFFLFRKEKPSDKRMTVTVNGRSFSAVLYDNKTADELYSRLPLELEMNELNGNEKYYNFSDSFTTNSKLAGHISKGDIKLYGDDCLVLFYDSFSSGYSYTDIGYIEDVSGFEEVLGTGNVTVNFSADPESRSDISDTSSAGSEPVSETTTTKQTTTAVTSATDIQTTTTTQMTATDQITPSNTTTSVEPIVTEPPVQSEDPITTGSAPKEESALKMEIAGIPVTVDWEDNDSVDALKELCGNGGLTIQMSMYGGFEQVGSIGTSLPRNDVQITTSSGDIVLYSGDQIVVFYGSNSWSYTKLGHITDSSGYTMEELLGNGDVSIKISLS